MKDILDRIADSSPNESSHELICRLRDCAHEIKSLRASRPDAQRCDGSGAVPISTDDYAECKACGGSGCKSVSHKWGDEGDRCVKCGDKDWMADASCSERLLKRTCRPDAQADERGASQDESDLCERIIHAVEGECDGLAITEEQASNILAYLQYGAPICELSEAFRIVDNAIGATEANDPDAGNLRIVTLRIDKAREVRAALAAAPQAEAAQGVPVAWQVRRADGRIDGVPIQWESCTKELYDATLATGRYAGYESGPRCEVRALCIAAPSPDREQVGEAHAVSLTICQTCNGIGWVGGPSYHAPDEGGEPCPDCCDTPSYCSSVRRCTAKDADQPKQSVPAPLSEYHEDTGPVVWWTWQDGLWLGEPSWIGTPTDSDWPGYHTHWTHHPEFPLPPLAEQPSERIEQDCPHGVDDGACGWCYDEATRGEQGAVLGEDQSESDDLQEQIEDLRKAVQYWSHIAISKHCDMPAADAVKALRHYIEESDGITIAIPYELGNALIAASAPTLDDQHADDIAVDSFARTMKNKMAEARAKGRSGWEGCDPAELSRMLRAHVEKGDPRDVANFCMMLWHHGTPIFSAVEQSSMDTMRSFFEAIVKYLEADLPGLALNTAEQARALLSKGA